MSETLAAQKMMIFYPKEALLQLSSNLELILAFGGKEDLKKKKKKDTIQNKEEKSQTKA